MSCSEVMLVFLKGISEYQMLKNVYSIQIVIYNLISFIYAFLFEKQNRVKEIDLTHHF